MAVSTTLENLKVLCFYGGLGNQQSTLATNITLYNPYSTTLRL